MCPWGEASILNLDLKNPILFNAIKAFNSLRIRVGGSLQDQVIYKVGANHPRCRRFRPEPQGMFGFTSGCLTSCRWDKLNDLFNKTGAVVTFGLNALIGRTKATADGKYTGYWNSSNACDFVNYTASKGFRVESCELGNELSGSGVSARVDATTYGEDLVALRALLDDIYRNSAVKPKVAAPGGFYDQDWFAKMLQVSGPNVVDYVSHHIYNLGLGNDKSLFYKMQDPFYLDRIAQTYKDVETTIKEFGPWSSAWVGESGGAFNSGGQESHTFLDSFWYLDQLGMSSTLGHKVFCRQALIGGNYALLNTTSVIPNPDYYMSDSAFYHITCAPSAHEKYVKIINLCIMNFT